MITQEFGADFSKFTDAVAGATAQLKSFTVDADKVGAALGRMTDQFSGAKVIQQASLMAEAIDRIGGVGQLTQKELARIAPTIQEAIDKAKLMGLEVPANLQKVHAATSQIPESIGTIGTIAESVAGPLAALFSVQAVISFAGEVLAAGDAIQKMADQTAMSTDEVQQLQYITGQAGSSMEALISAAQNVTVAIGNGDAGVTRALGRMNISLEDFKHLGTYEQMLALSDGIRAIKDPTDQAAAAADLFKLKWKELLPTLKSDMRAVGDEAPRMSAAAVAGLDAMGDAMTRLKQIGIAAAGETFLAVANMGDTIGDVLSRLDLSHFGEATSHVLQRYAEENTRTLAAIPPLQEAIAEGFRHITVTATEAAAIAQKMSDQATANMDRRAAALEGMRQAMIDEAQKANEAYWTGVDKLIDAALGIDQALTVNMQTANQWSDAMDRLNDNVGALSATMRGELIAAMQGGIAAMAAAGTLTQQQSARFTELMLAADAYSDTLRAAATITAEASGTVTAYTQALYDAALAEDRARDAAAGHNAELERTKAAADAAAEAMNNARQYSLMASAPTPESLAAAAMNPGSMLGFGTPSTFTGAGWNPSMPIYQAPGRAAGGPVAAGATYVVGERGPELFTPGASGAITPAGAVVVTNTFHLVDTAANLARQVSDLIARSITQARRV